MIRIIMCLVIVIILFNSLVLSLNKPCLQERETITIKKLSGVTIPNIHTLVQDDTRVFDDAKGIFDLRLKLDASIPCGIYRVSTHYGPAILIIGRNEEDVAQMNFISVTKEKLAVKRFEMWDAVRLISSENDFINTYNKGCCEGNRTRENRGWTGDSVG